jgi:hypothetical protein
MLRNRLIVTLFVAIVSLSLITVAGAAPIFSEDFEAYNLGDLNGQGGWTTGGQGLGVIQMPVHGDQGVAPTPAAPGVGTALKTFTGVAGGVSVSFQGLVNYGVAGGTDFLDFYSYDSGVAFYPYISMAYSGSGTLADIKFGICGHPTVFATTDTSWVWYDFKFDFDLANDDVSGSYKLETATTWTLLGTLDLNNSEGTSSGVTTIDTVEFRQKRGTTGHSRIDNILVVPEPVTLVVVCLGAVACLAGRRRH